MLALTSSPSASFPVLDTPRRRSRPQDFSPGGEDLNVTLLFLSPLENVHQRGSVIVIKAWRENPSPIKQVVVVVEVHAGKIS